MVFNDTFNNISVLSRQLVLLMEEIRVPVENHRTSTDHDQSLCCIEFTSLWTSSNKYVMSIEDDNPVQQYKNILYRNKRGIKQYIKSMEGWVRTN